MRRFFVIVLVVLAAVGGGAAVGLRGARNKIGQPGLLKPDFALVTNAASISVYAARVAPGPHVVFFDSGIDPKGRPVEALLATLGASPDDVTDVFLTHGHGDHIGGVPLLPKARVHLGAPDVPLAAGQIEPDALLPRLFGKVLANPPLTANAPITGAASFPVGSPDPAKVVKAFPVPGHTPGSYAFLYDGVLMVGDIMLLNAGPAHSAAARLQSEPRAEPRGDHLAQDAARERRRRHRLHVTRWLHAQGARQDDARRPRRPARRLTPRAGREFRKRARGTV